MFDSSLGTTNLLIGIIAAASVLQAVVLTGVAVAAWKLYARSREALDGAREQFDPVVARANELAGRLDGIADDVKSITSRVAAAAERAELAASIARKTLGVYGIARGLRAAYRSFTQPDGKRPYTE